MKLYKRIRRETDTSGSKEKTRHPNQKVRFMNMCMISDGEGNLVMLQKVGGRYQGATFPGGHVERDETFLEAVVREVREETGLVIEAPKFCGFYHWFCDNVHHMVYIYLAEKYMGKLCSSEEGEVCWVKLDELKKLPLARTMEKTLQLFLDDNISEYSFRLENGERIEILK